MLERRDFLLAAGAAFAREELRVEETPGGHISIRHGQVRLLAYRYAKDRPKTYVHPLCLPDGTPVTRDGPADHIHHRGLMVAWSEVNGFDFWGEDNPAPHGQILHGGIERTSGGTTAEIVARTRWVAGGELLLTERRTIRVTLADGGTWVDWITELRAAGKPVDLAAGSHVYNGLGVRVPAEMDGGRVVNSRGTATIEQANGEAAQWCAYGGAGLGVAMFDHPANPRHPNAFFVMNRAFGYMSAAPTFRAPFRIEPGAGIRFHWGVFAFRGEPARALLDARFRQWSRGA